MPLVTIKWTAGKSVECKEQVRREIAEGMGTVHSVDPKFVAVLFEDYPPENMTHHGSFVILYMSEGKSDAVKDGTVRCITDVLCKRTDLMPDKVNIMIVDVRKGSMATGGKIVNRGGPVADLINQGKEPAEW